MSKPYTTQQPTTKDAKTDKDTASQNVQRSVSVRFSQQPQQHETRPRGISMRYHKSHKSVEEISMNFSDTGTTASTFHVPMGRASTGQRQPWTDVDPITRTTNNPDTHRDIRDAADIVANVVNASSDRAGNGVFGFGIPVSSATSATSSPSITTIPSTPYNMAFIHRSNGNMSKTTSVLNVGGGENRIAYVDGIIPFLGPVMHRRGGDTRASRVITLVAAANALGAPSNTGSIASIVMGSRTSMSSSKMSVESAPVTPTRHAMGSVTDRNQSTTRLATSDAGLSVPINNQSKSTESTSTTSPSTGNLSTKVLKKTWLSRSASFSKRPVLNMTPGLRYTPSIHHRGAPITSVLSKQLLLCGDEHGDAGNQDDGPSNTVADQDQTPLSMVSVASPPVPTESLPEPQQQSDGVEVRSNDGQNDVVVASTYESMSTHDKTLHHALSVSKPLSVSTTARRYHSVSGQNSTHSAQSPHTSPTDIVPISIESHAQTKSMGDLDKPDVSPVFRPTKSSVYPHKVSIPHTSTPYTPSLINASPDSHHTKKYTVLPIKLLDPFFHPFQESPMTGWTLKFPSPIETMFEIYIYYVMIRKIQGWTMIITVLTWFTISVTDLVVYRSPDHVVRQVCNIVVVCVGLTCIALSYHKKWYTMCYRAMIVYCLVMYGQVYHIGLSIGYLNTHDMELFRPVLLVFIISSIAMSYITVSAHFVWVCGISIVFSVVQVVTEIVCGYYRDPVNQVASALLHVSVNIIGIFFKYSFELYLRKAFVRYRVLYHNKEELGESRARSDALLCHILPSKIVSSMRHLDDTDITVLKESISDLFNEVHGVTILFSDIAGFTEFSGTVTASTLVGILNDIFSVFDGIASDLQLEKIKTIGDSIHIAGGVPEQLATNAEIIVFARRVCIMGVEMIRAFNDICRERDIKVKLRVGVHTGSVVGGIMGLWKFKYDIWSKDVDIASLMEQTGKPGIVHVSQATYSLLSNDPSFHFVPADPVDTSDSHGSSDKHDQDPASIHCADDTKIPTYDIVNYDPDKTPTSVGVMLTNTNMVPDASNATVLNIPSSQAPPLLSLDTDFQKQSTTIPTTQSTTDTTKPMRMNDTKDATQPQYTVNQDTSKSKKSLIQILRYKRFRQKSKSKKSDAMEHFDRELDPYMCVFTTPIREEQYRQFYLATTASTFSFTMTSTMIFVVQVLLVVIRTCLLHDHALSLLVIDLVGLCAFVGTVAIFQGMFVWAQSKNQESASNPESDKMKQESEWFDADTWFAFWVPNGLAVTMMVIVAVTHLSYLGTVTLITETAAPNDLIQFLSAIEIILILFHLAFFGICTLYMRIWLVLMVTVHLFVYLGRLISATDSTLTNSMSTEWIPCITILCITGLAYFISLFTDRLLRMNFFLEYENATHVLQMQQAQLASERLILNILPQSVVERFANGETRIADARDEVCIIFISMTNFKPNTANKDWIWALNDMICDIDILANRHGIEKIKTIGTKYMAMCEPRQHESDQVESMDIVVRAALFALDLVQMVSAKTGGIGVKIGINVGPAVTGVIGTKTIAFDVWGDTVNVASRMESTGSDGRIQITEAVASRCMHAFVVQERGTVLVKGKGQMLTFWLLSHKHLYEQKAFQTEKCETTT